MIELLITIAVIGVLSALLLGAVGRVKERALVAGDISNLRQIGVALFQYLGENNNRLPPVVGSSAKPKFTQEFLAVQMGITADFQDQKTPRSAMGVWISPSDKRVFPALSGLRSYAVNYYMGEIHNKTESDTAILYSQVVKPSNTLYFLPSEGDIVTPLTQARFAETTYPFGQQFSTMRTRFNAGVTAALWADGHVSAFSLEDATKNGTQYIFPKRAK